MSEPKEKASNCFEKGNSAADLIFDYIKTRDERDALAAELEKVKADNAILKEVLEWYANQHDAVPSMSLVYKINFAREALAKVGK
jgi:hypothetical protein